MTALSLALLIALPTDVVHVRNVQELRSAVANAKPGTKILLAPGEYPGGLHFSNVHGTAAKPIEIGAENALERVRFVGGNGLQFSEVSHLILRSLTIERAAHNGLNIDDGGTPETPSHHITLHQLRVTDLPPGNRDGIKLSGVTDFTVKTCSVERWGGSGIDMVGCHDGLILNCTFRDGGDSGVQAKGGSRAVVVRNCRFENYGQRGVNLGGSTGEPYFRPPLDGWKGEKYEATDLTVEGCTFVGGVAPLAFVGCDGATVRFNTIVHPERWAMRILQETRLPGFVPSRHGVFERNLVVFRSGNWFEGGVNVGPGTAADTFRFTENFWFCSDRPERSAPRLPAPETGGTVGKDPLFQGAEKGDYRVREGSPAATHGAHAFKRP